MTATGDFPSNCSTNVYILQDFGEVAYIVCTVSIPPFSNHTVQAPSPENNLARLRRTESQFRQASILAVIDPESSQLFTFYKKVDVLKDQKSLLTKFGTILRSNSCTVSYKAAARVPELFKPEHAKLYRLFVSAILASLKVVAGDDRRIIRLGQRYHVVEHHVEEVPSPGANADWLLVRIDLQIVQTGHVTLTVVVNHDIKLVTLASVMSQLPKVTGLVLAPGGQIAFYRHEVENSAHAAMPGLESTTLVGERRSIWQAGVTDWLRNAGASDIPEDLTSWVELMLPAFEQRSDENVDVSLPKASADPERRLIFKPILWPAHMCFARSLDQSLDNIEMSVDEDPLQFVLEWIQTAGERETELLQQSSQDPKDDESTLFADEGPFDGVEAFQQFGPPAFPASQTVYPTPPDAVMTHATPAMSSVDGLVTTPTAITRGAIDTTQGRQDVEMTDADPVQTSAVGSGFYDEDLFEEMPEGTFDQEGGGDEPNWDFFDKPDTDVDQPQGEGVVIVGKSSKASPRETGCSRSKSKDSETQPEVRKPHVPEEMPVDPLHVPATTEHRSEKLAQEPAREQQSRELSAEVAGAACEKQDADYVVKRRHSSIYNVAEPTQDGRTHDAKYSQRGEFWFNADAKLQRSDRIRTLDDWRHRDPSPPSETDSDSYSSDGDNDSSLVSPATTKPFTARPWHDYQPASVAEGLRHDGVDSLAVDAEIKATLSLLNSKSSGPFLEDVFARKKVSTTKVALSAELQLVLAQIFVDQYTQASLIHSEASAEDEQRDSRSMKSVSIDLSQMNGSVGYATVSQLTEITTPAAARQTLGKTTRLADQLIAAKRSDKLIIASPTIISLWDTLALQPYSQPKDTTAFCLHPPGAGYADACANFVRRIADAYGSCGLGTHRIGILPGLTSNGVIAMAPEPMTVARRFAETLTSNTDLTGTAIVYIVGKSGDYRSYLGCCRYFLGLFTYYKNYAASRGKPLEMVLQVIPASFLVSNDTLVIPAQRKYNDLAFEIYSRIPPESPSAAAGTCNYPLTLADNSDNVKFSLESQAMSPRSKNGSVLHLAYAVTEDQRWLIATWTDALGQKALIMTYQLKSRNESKGRPREDIIKEMWEVSRDLMKKQRSKWQLVVARTGFYEAAELNGWMHVANAETKSQSCELCLLAIEIQATLKLLAPVLHGKLGQPPGANQQPMYGTPASTPQAISTTSPENVIPATSTPGGTSAPNAPTPPDHSFDPSVDGDLSLVDPVEESWAVILSFGTNQSYNILDIRPALLSGYLVKRLGVKDEDGLTALGVHLVHAPAQPPPGTSVQREELLQDVLEQYRGLVTLAMARGCIDTRRGILPWHVHTSTTGSSVLGTLL